MLIIDFLLSLSLYKVEIYQSPSVEFHEYYVSQFFAFKVSYKINPVVYSYLLQNHLCPQINSVT